MPFSPKTGTKLLHPRPLPIVEWLGQLHRSPGLHCVSPCYRNRAVCLPRRKLILRSTIYRAICLPRRNIVTTYRAICLPRRKNITIYRAICLPQCWNTVTKYHLKNRGVGKHTIRYHITHRLKNRGTPKPYHFLQLSKALPVSCSLF